MTDSDIIEVVKTMTDAGMQITAVYEPIGCTFCLRPSDVAAMLKDRDEFFASECGLAKKEYVDWRRFVLDGRKCVATVAGEACKNAVQDSEELSPQVFIERKAKGDLLCGEHRHKSP